MNKEIWLEKGQNKFTTTIQVLTGRGSNPDESEIFRKYPDRPWIPLSLLCNGYQVFPGNKERSGREVTPHPLLVTWSRKSRAIPLLPL
jgi:hypothetical protein